MARQVRILLITYCFPPDAEVGGMRPYHFARLLPQRGVEPWVLTVDREFALRWDEGFVVEGVSRERICRTTVVRPGLQRAVLAGLRVRRALSRYVRSRHTYIGRSASAHERRGGGGPWFGRQVLRGLVFPGWHAGWYGPAVDTGSRLVREHGIEMLFSTSPPRVGHLIGRALSLRHRVPWIMDLRDPWYSPWDNEAGDSELLARRYER